jgi:ABC-type phosphate transport system substrate-binding protein
MRAAGNEGVAGRIKHAVGSIGYVGYEFARKAELPIARLENRAGQFVAPAEASSSAALTDVQLPESLRVYVPDPSGPDAYPIVTLTWILLYKHYAEAQKGRELHDLFRWCLTDGQQYAARSVTRRCLRRSSADRWPRSRPFSSAAVAFPHIDRMSPPELRCPIARREDQWA